MLKVVITIFLIVFLIWFTPLKGKANLSDYLLIFTIYILTFVAFWANYFVFKSKIFKSKICFSIFVSTLVSGTISVLFILLLISSNPFALSLSIINLNKIRIIAFLLWTVVLIYSSCHLISIQVNYKNQKLTRVIFSVLIVFFAVFFFSSSRAKNYDQLLTTDISIIGGANQIDYHNDKFNSLSSALSNNAKDNYLNYSSYYSDSNHANVLNIITSSLPSSTNVANILESNGARLNYHKDIGISKAERPSISKASNWNTLKEINLSDPTTYPSTINSNDLSTIYNHFLFRQWIYNTLLQIVTIATLGYVISSFKDLFIKTY